MEKETRSNSLEQFRDLLRDHGAAIAMRTAASIADVRLRAADKLLNDSDIAFPQKGEDGYEYTDLNAMFATDMGVNVNRIPVTAAVEGLFRCGLPHLSPLLAIWINDTFRLTDRFVALKPEGVSVVAFGNAKGDDLKAIEKYYGNVAKADGNHPTTLLNTALAQEGVLVRIGKDVSCDRPIQLVTLLKSMTAPSGEELPVLALNRLLIVMESGSRASLLLCDHDVSDRSVSAMTRVCEVVMAENSRLDLYSLEESSTECTHYTRTVCRVGADCRLNMFYGTLHPGKTRNDIEVHLEGRGSELNVDGLAIADANQLADNCAVVYHHAPHCKSFQKFKYLVRETGKGAFEGLIRVDTGATGTEAYQNDRNILGDTGARMHSRPQLEIYCDDVKCSHGAATGQLDEKALFYMRSRGIGLDEARAMLMNAFMADVIERVQLLSLKDRLKHLVERRLSGEPVHCNECPIE